MNIIIVDSQNYDKHNSQLTPNTLCFMPLNYNVFPSQIKAERNKVFNYSKSLTQLLSRISVFSETDTDIIPQFRFNKDAHNQTATTTFSQTSTLLFHVIHKENFNLALHNNSVSCFVQT